MCTARQLTAGHNGTCPIGLGLIPVEQNESTAPARSSSESRQLGNGGVNGHYVQRQYAQRKLPRGITGYHCTTLYFSLRPSSVRSRRSTKGCSAARIAGDSPSATVEISEIRDTPKLPTDVPIRKPACPQNSHRSWIGEMDRSPS